MTRPLAYCDDPTALFQTLCGDKSDSLLLESAEIDSKQNLKSLLLVDAAVRIVCRGQQVTLSALTANGDRLLHAVNRHLAAEKTSADTISIQLSQSEGYTELTLGFTPADNALDEDTKLHQSSSFDALRLIRTSVNLPEHDKYALFVGGLFAYDLVANFEPLGSADEHNHCPDYVFYVAETLLVIDHQAQSCLLQASLFDTTQAISQQIQQRLNQIEQQSHGVHTAPIAQTTSPLKVSVNISDNDFATIVSDLKQYVVRGDVFQVVPSRCFTLPCPSPLAAYRVLKQTNPSPYMFYMQDEHFTLFGASPESALKYDAQSNQVEIYPIAGTRRRGKKADGTIDLDLDSRIELELRSDTKENAEHMMLVDLARNDVARISTPGTRHVADLLKVDRYSHVMHLVSRVVGQLRPDFDALHAYQACMNMGTLTGAPKIRAMQLIRQVEGRRRGAYGGAVGYLTGDGTLDTCIVIRSAYVEQGIAHVQAGAGVVFDSDPIAETDETRGKAQAVLTAIQAAHQGA
ncbi:anthranilate synthase component 1 [Vibrio agarilyticus]